MENIKTNRQFWSDLSDEECTSELNKFDLITLKTVLWGDTALKYLKMVKSGKILFSQIQNDLRFLVTSSLAFLFESFEKPIIKGLNVYIFQCGLSFKTFPMIEHGFNHKIIENKSIAECEHILRRETFNCGWDRFRKTDRENTYVRPHGYRKYEIAIISETKPNITQKEVRYLVKNYNKLPNI